MEFFIACACIIGFFVVLKLAKSSRKISIAPQEEVERSHRKLTASGRVLLDDSFFESVKKLERLDESSEQPPPFDPSTAKPVPPPAVIHGPAYVVDGDTIVIHKVQIRLYGIDAPEIDHPYGKKAKWVLVTLCKGKQIRAEIGEQDAHGRTVAKCYLPDGSDLSAEMVKQGMAIDWPKYSGGYYSSLETSDARKKLWLADARQKGRMHVWEKFEAKQRASRR